MCHDVDLTRNEALPVGLLDQIERMLVMAASADVVADVVKQRGVLEELALLAGQAVKRLRGVEELECECRHMMDVPPVPSEAEAELVHRPPPDVRERRAPFQPSAVRADVILD